MVITLVLTLLILVRVTTLLGFPAIMLILWSLIRAVLSLEIG